MADFTNLDEQRNNQKDVADIGRVFNKKLAN